MLLRHVIEIRQVTAPHLSFCCSTAIIYYKCKKLQFICKL